ncbi:unnamed protein product [Vitrella brassicaformis CCMP3155]|uniref:Heme O synthase n=2 Tax=Vitrella brassicaformis TaxID=1169539 RepID=A0A0G4EN68_VITBC|nr:unnamed protein product [Vitrella brassicaformis CCMP3155]|eukprot:CEL98276.1 unnamed protein product [Vitrella brassicaformis CCMP3155]
MGPSSFSQDASRLGRSSVRLLTTSSRQLCASSSAGRSDDGGSRHTRTSSLLIQDPDGVAAKAIVGRRVRWTAFERLAVISEQLRRTKARVAPYWSLSKGKLTTWIALSTLPGYALMCVDGGSFVAAMSLTVGTGLSSAAASTYNQLIEAPRDARMRRTHNRPLVNGTIDRSSAHQFAALCAVGGVSLLAMGTTPTCAMMAAGNIFLYSCVYTPLKTVTPYNTHIGAVVGSIPPLLGCTAAQGMSAFCLPEPFVLFAIQTLWQFPHFYALAWMYREDYVRGGFTMFPVFDHTGWETADLMRPYLMALCILPLATSAFNVTSYMFVVSSMVPNGLLLWRFTQYDQNPSIRTARTFFRTSLVHILALLGLFVFHCKGPYTEGTEGRGGRGGEKGRISRWRAFLDTYCLHRLVDGVHCLCPVELATDMVIKQQQQQQQRDGPQ